MMTQALKRLKATAKTKSKSKTTAAPKLDPKDQKAFDAALKKAFKGRDKVVKDLDAAVVKFKKQYLSDESLRGTLLADFDGSGSLDDALADMLDEFDQVLIKKLPEFFTMDV